jgi:ubiquinone biosynthesis protein
VIVIMDGAPTPPRPLDLVHGTFSADPPWLVNPDDMPWRRGLDDVRNRVQRSVPRLIAPRRVPPGRRVVRTVWSLGTAVGGWWAWGRRRGGSASKADLSRRVRLAMEHLGPTYIKLAQIISAGEGLFPAELTDEMKKCRDRVAPEPFETVLGTLRRELGRDPFEVFAHIDPEATAAASVAQVHTARLHSGEDVVVKVQRATVGQRVGDDLRVLAWLAPHLVGRIPVAALANPPALVEMFAHTISEELDFRLEAENLLDVARVLRELEQDDWVIPRPHPVLVSPRMLVMEQVGGFAFEDVAGMTGAGVDTHAVVRNVMIAFLESATLHGIFHGDFHGGNLFVQPDGKVALLDFGITARMTELERGAFLRLMVGGTTNNIAMQMAAMRDLGALPPDTDLDAVIADLGLAEPVVDPTTLSQEELLAEVQRITRALLAYGARMPKVLMLFVKNMMFLSSMIEHLAPDIDVISEVQLIGVRFAIEHGQRIASESGLSLDAADVDMTGFKASLGLEAETETITYAQLRRRRELILRRMGGADD